MIEIIQQEEALISVLSAPRRVQVAVRIVVDLIIPLMDLYVQRQRVDRVSASVRSRIELTDLGTV